MCELIFTLHRSCRCPGRFALGCPHGPVLSNGRAIYLRRGRGWIDGYVEASGGVWWFIRDGESWFTRRVKLRAGMKVWL
mgnify:CR=1 FL=1